MRRRSCRVPPQAVVGWGGVRVGGSTGSRRTHIWTTWTGGAVGRPPGAGRGLGDGGEILHEWIREADIGEFFADLGAMVASRRMFDVPGAWDGNTPGGLPCLVLTHRVPQRWAGPGSSFTFVTSGIEDAVGRAQHAAGGKNVCAGGGADIVRQAVDAGLVGEMRIQLVPVLLGVDVRLFEQLQTAPVRLAQARVDESRSATHLSYTADRRRP
jgi:dihydrofolate reductase